MNINSNKESERIMKKREEQDNEININNINFEEKINKINEEIGKIKDNYIKLIEKNNKLEQEIINIRKNNSKLIEEINILKNDNNKLKEEISIIKNINKEKRIKINNKLKYKEFIENPVNLKYNKIITNNIDKYNLLYEFVVYTSYIDNNDYLISPNKDTYNLDIYNINDNIFYKSLKGHNNHICSVRYFYNKKENIGYIISSDVDKLIIIWDDEDYNIKYKIDTKYKDYKYFGISNHSNLLLFDIEGNNYIVTSSFNCYEYSRLYEFSNNNKIIRNIYNSNDHYTYFIYYWHYNNNHYIIENSCNRIYILNIFKDEKYHVFNTNHHDHYEGLFYNKNYYIIIKI